MKKKKKLKIKNIRFRFNLSKKKKQTRIKSYLNEAIILSLAITTILFALFSYDIIFINFYSIIPTNAILAIFLVLFLLLILNFVIMFIGDYLFSEFFVRKHHSLAK